MTKHNICQKSNNISKEPFNKYNTLVILDWDNTLFPTSWFMQKQSNNTEHFIELDDTLYKLLTRIQQYANVMIITNAMTEWINTSSSVLPKTRKLLDHIKVISAKENYMKSHKNMMDWKKMAFKNELNPQIINIISIGDAHFEYNALIGLHNKQNNILLKSIKFVDEPHHETLIDQLNVLYDVIPSICQSTKHHDLIFKMKQSFKKIK